MAEARKEKKKYSKNMMQGNLHHTRKTSSKKSEISIVRTHLANVEAKPSPDIPRGLEASPSSAIGIIKPARDLHSFTSRGGGGGGVKEGISYSMEATM